MDATNSVGVATQALSNKALLLQIVIDFLRHNITLRILHLFNILISRLYFAFILLELLVKVDGFLDFCNLAEKRGVLNAEGTKTVSVTCFIL